MWMFLFYYLKWLFYEVKQDETINIIMVIIVFFFKCKCVVGYIEGGDEFNSPITGEIP